MSPLWREAAGLSTSQPAGQLRGPYPQQSFDELTNHKKKNENIRKT